MTQDRLDKMAPNSADGEYTRFVVVLNRCVDRMRRRFEEKQDEGWSGWDDEDGDEMEANRLIVRVVKNLTEGDWLDAALLCVMGWNLYQKYHKKKGGKR